MPAEPLQLPRRQRSLLNELKPIHLVIAVLVIVFGVRQEMLNSELRAAVNRLDFPSAFGVIKRGANPNTRGNDGLTALMLAHDPYEGYQVAHRGADVNARNDQGYTALTYAVMGGDEKLVSLLVKNGANPRVRDNNGDSVSDWASKLEYPAISRLLRETR